MGRDTRLDHVSTKIPPESGRPSTESFAPLKSFDGAVDKCITLARPGDVEEFIRRWYRAQMRQWAGNWRLSRQNAATSGKPVEEGANTAVKFAALYRDSAKERRRPRLAGGKSDGSQF